ncbi:MAG TPA: DUF4238 domain-containing protein [Anaerolineales bacterium]|nr:DUF4238 domain-containing protein [Anaerolineales bacterium]
MDYKNQHFVPKSYLKAWCDPKTPNDGAYVWVVSKKDRSISRKSPSSLFSETDFYTVYDSFGDRILELEHKLQEIESKFILLRDSKLQKYQLLTFSDRRSIALFISTMYARTKIQKADNQQTWEEYIEYIESLPEALSARIKQTIEFRTVQEFYKTQPMPFHVFHFVNMTAPLLYFMNCAIYRIDQNPGFITSDNPCLWMFDHTSPQSSSDFVSPKPSIVLPISPKQYISLEPRGPDGYLKLSDDPIVESDLVDQVNSLLVANADKYLVVNQKTFKDTWFGLVD